MIFITKVACCFLVYWCTYTLNHRCKFGAVKASASIGLILGICFQFCINTHFYEEFLKDYFLIMMGATFMGMIGKIHQHQLVDFLISSLIFCTLYQHTSHFFNGFGGLLGTIACISILCVFGIERILSKMKI